jgi:hypothetical protein
MARDKKNKKGDVHFVLLARAGEVHRSDGWTTPVPVRQITEALAVIE